MINLLPQENLKADLADYRQRKWIVGLYLLLSLILITIIVGSSSHWLIRHELADLKQELKRVTNQVSTEEYDTLVSALEQSALQLSILEFPEKMAPPPAMTIDLIDRHQNSGTSFSALSYKTNEDQSITATISGRASTRQDLLQLIESLKAAEQVRSLDSPIDNLIKDRDIEYKLSITLAPLGPIN